MSLDRTAVYLINLDKDEARYKNVIPQLKKLGLPITRVPGVHGRDLTSNERASLTTSLCNAFCTPSMIGCAASHLKAWKLFLQSDQAAVLICEDDIALVDDCR